MFIREEILDKLGLTVSEVAKVLDVRRATLSNLVNGNAALSAEMAAPSLALPPVRAQFCRVGGAQRNPPLWLEAVGYASLHPPYALQCQPADDFTVDGMTTKEPLIHN